MINVTLNQAKRLAALGFPQDRFPSIYWWYTSQLPKPRLILRASDLDGTWGMHYQDTVTMRAAPVYVTGDGATGALEWLEREHGIRWERSSRGWVCTRASLGRELILAMAATASELLDTILTRIEAAPPLEEAKR